MKKLYVLLLLITTTTPSNILLQKPKHLTEQDIQERAQKWETRFSWKFGKGTTFSLYYLNGEASMLLQVFGIPVRSYNFHYFAFLKKLFTYLGEDHHPYYYAKPIKLTEQSPETLTTEDLADFLRYKHFIFYTGAGISAASNVATMDALQQSLALDPHHKTQFFKKTFFDPKPIVDAFKIFCKSAIDSMPTSAHYALHQIANHRDCSIVTENVDLLQQRTGCEPLHTHGIEINQLKPDDLKNIDAILCIGLSKDDCGFLANYKTHNPNGILIAINRTVPEYISDQDYVVLGDIQTIVPEVAKLLCIR